ncbi:MULTISPECIES: fimbrial protein [Pseudomonas]|uniref:fimbrial protein n=1 Tax=Pseudomonas TaxID=286 RepID=UPI00224B786A|nr:MULTISPECIES: fimbrial protein [unclassified Pseudomonas]MCX2891042.1 fimbrial protein [Pseudomonas sp. DCB_BI]MDH4551538.1 type 1 fimbrial protein [Pseudomonas sp. BN607]
MKKALIPLALAFASNAALAAPAPGIINFYGGVQPAGPCPIEVVDPTTGIPSQVELGFPYASQFKNEGDKTPARDFALKITPVAGVCDIGPGVEVAVVFESVGGATGSGNDLYKLLPGSTPDLAISILDKDGNRLAPGTASAMYPVAQLGDTLMPFSAHYEAIKVPVTDGSALANVKFVVNIP